MLNDVKLSVVILGILVLSVLILSVVILSVVILSTVILSVIMLSVLSSVCSGKDMCVMYQASKLTLRHGMKESAGDIHSSLLQKDIPNYTKNVL